MNSCAPVAGPAGAAGPAAVVALKSLNLAKSRFSGAPPGLRRQLALRMLGDTVSALDSALERVLVVTAAAGIDALLGQRIQVLADPGGGLNAAFEAGARQLAYAGHSPVLAVVADLPALRPETVRELSSRCSDADRCFLRDKDGVGTTMLSATGSLIQAGQFCPSFEHHSADAHLRSGAVELNGPWPDARTDVDSPSDLSAARQLGLGPRTAALADVGDRSAADVLGSTGSATVIGPAAEGWLAIDDAGFRCQIPAGCLEPWIRHLRPGQRVGIQRHRSRVVAAWL